MVFASQADLKPKSMPFDVARAYDEALGIKDSRTWTVKRGDEMRELIA